MRRAAALTSEGFRREEGILLIGQQLVIATLLLCELYFWSFTELGSTLVLILFSLRLALSFLERAWVLRKAQTWDSLHVESYARLSILGQLGFAAILAIGAPSDHSHFVALFILPIVAAAFRLSRPWLFFVTLLSVTFGLTEVLLEGLRGETRLGLELYEYCSVALAYIFVAFATRLLVLSLRWRQEKLEESLRRLAEEESLAAIGRLSAALAHELRNPLAMLKASASTLAALPPDDPERPSLEKILQRESDRLEGLTSEFLDYARPRRPRLENTRLRVLLEYITSLARARAAQSRVNITIDCPEDLEFDLDAAELERAILNLVDNAIAASPPQSSVRLIAQGLSPLRLRIENSGPAIPKDDLPQLFEPFFTRRKGGSGLGLAIARKIVEAHGGSLELRDNQDALVAFEIVIPSTHDGAKGATR